MNVRRTKISLLVAAAAAMPSVVPRLAMSQDYGPHDSQSGYAPNTYVAPDYSYQQYPTSRWHRPFRIFCEPTYYRPIQPSDWGCGPYGPRHNLNASQKSPSGMTWW